MNRQGGQSMRNMSGFGAQPNRNTTQMGGSTRMPNGKMNPLPGSAGGGWPFGGQNGAPGLPPTSRTPLSGASFAQSLGAGQQSSAPLDPSDFPSLSNNASTAFPNPSSQAVWASARPNVRAEPGTSSSTQMGGFSGRLFPGRQDAGRQQMGQLDPNDDARGGLDNGTDVLGDNDILGGVTGRADPTGPPPAIDEFPPLGGLGSSDLGQDRRVNMMQNAANNGSAARQHNPEDSLDLSGSPVADLSPPNADTTTRANLGTSNTPGHSSNGSNKQSSREPILDRFGLPDTLARIRSDDAEVQALAIGHDLTTLGLDLSSNEQLWPTWSGPFGTGPPRPITPEFQLPSCYKVNNVRPLQDKISNFNTETLFIIFYQMPGDVAQEYAAYELTHRNWRFHKVHKFWFTRGAGAPAPFTTADGERGIYEIFNFPLMRRENRQMLVRWVEIDDHILPAGPFEAVVN